MGALNANKFNAWEDAGAIFLTYTYARARAERYIGGTHSSHIRSVNKLPILPLLDQAPTAIDNFILFLFDRCNCNRSSSQHPPATSLSDFRAPPPLSPEAKKRRPSRKRRLLLKWHRWLATVRRRSVKTLARKICISLQKLGESWRGLRGFSRAYTYANGVRGAAAEHANSANKFLYACIGNTLSTLVILRQAFGKAVEIDKLNPLQTISRLSQPSPKKEKSFFRFASGDQLPHFSVILRFC
jgi:hypothetical protein